MRMGGGALKRHQKQNRKKLQKTTRNSPQKVTQNETALSSVQVSIMFLFFKIYVILTDKNLKQFVFLHTYNVDVRKKKRFIQS